MRYSSFDNHIIDCYGFGFAVAIVLLSVLITTPIGFVLVMGPSLVQIPLRITQKTPMKFSLFIYDLGGVGVMQQICKIQIFI